MKSVEEEKGEKEVAVSEDEKEFAPPVFDTQHPKLRAHFENYEGGVEFINGEPTFDEVREEIAEHFGVPNDEKHMFIIDNKMVVRMRHYRAFCVLRREVNGKMEAWYIDGRLPHATMLRRFYDEQSKKRKNDDKNDDKKDDEYDESEGDKYEKFLGFLDDEGFPDVPDIQKRVSEEKKEIRWFVRYTVSPS
jgi:hypothetical protein